MADNNKLYTSLKQNHINIWEENGENKMDSDLCYGIIFAIVIIIIVGFIIIAFPGSKGFLAMLVPIMIGLGTVARMWDKEDEENNKCRNCGHELDDDANFCPLCGTKRL